MIIKGLVVAGALLLAGTPRYLWAVDEDFSFGYIQRQYDTAYVPQRGYTGLSLRDQHPPIDGAKVALQESRAMQRALGLTFSLVTKQLEETEDVVSAIEALASQGTRVLLLDLPIADVKQAATALADRDLLLFNIRHRANALRDRDCSPVLFHTIPSDAMLVDGLSQYLFKKRWTDVLILEGETEADKALSAAFQASARKFRINVVGTRAFVLSNDPRARDQTNIPLLTGDARYDIVFLADSFGEFGRYVPYRTYRARPVVGSEGLAASSWHWTWERHGAPQLNQRFYRIAKRHMTGTDWAAWAAVKSVIEAVVRTQSQDIVTVRRYLTSDAFTLDTYKGAPGSFRKWNRQLRQAVLLHTHNAVVASAPIEGFLHQANNLDTLGRDRPESACRID